ncbi:TPA: hypothetical protein ACJOB4_000760 [Streptococcus agalactiae]
MSKKTTQMVSYTSILVAFAIMIPIIMPAKIIIGPASFTLASHVPLFLSIFISVPFAILVALGTGLGFLLAGFPIVIVLRALSHIGFALIAAFLIKSKPSLLMSKWQTLLFAVAINIIHGLLEFITVYIITMTSNSSSTYLWSLFSLIGLGSLLHGLVDFYIALFIWKWMTQKLGKTLRIR